MILKVSLAAWNHGGASTASQSSVIVMESTAETAAAPTRCKVGWGTQVKVFCREI
jgi:hypothetical protein